MNRVKGQNKKAPMWVLVGSLFVFLAFSPSLTSCQAAESKIPEIRRHRKTSDINVNTFSQEEAIFVNFTRKLLSKLDSNCLEPSEVSYRSQQLISPNRRFKVFLRAVYEDLQKGKSFMDWAAQQPISQA
jgi:esterase/lipase superfamily enzyme